MSRRAPRSLGEPLEAKPCRCDEPVVTWELDEPPRCLYCGRSVEPDQPSKPPVEEGRAPGDSPRPLVGSAIR